MKEFTDFNRETHINVIKIGASVFILTSFGYIFNNIYQKHSYNIIIKKKQEQLQKKKDDLSNKLQDIKKNFADMENITSISLEGLLVGLESGKYNPLDVLHAYQSKALLLDKDYNFITDLNPNAEMDASSSMTKKGLLKGIPISIKDFFYVKDCDCTFGMPSLCFKPALQDSTLISGLRMQGAVPFVMTNMGQSGVLIESSNPIFGQTLNPFNKERTCGGSSGGEGTILGLGASILGIGSDIGGSIRIPSSYCGIFGLKPTVGRFSNRNIINTFAVQNIINVSVGPMARRFDDLLTLFKAMASDDVHRLDPYCPPLSFNEGILLKKQSLRIGYYTHLGGKQVTPTPAVLRAVNRAKKALESAGHTLVEFSIPNADKAILDLYMRCLFNDGGYGYINKFIKGNPVDSSLSLTVNLLKIPNILKKLISYIIYPFNRNYSCGLYALSGVSSVYNLWELNDQVNEYKEEVLTKWQNEKLDGIICPVLPISAPPCQTSKYIMDIIGYSAIYNVLDYPAGSVPVTHVNQKDIDELLASYPKDTPTHRQIIKYQKESLGMPVGVQCVALPWREELCLRIMGDIDKNLQ